MKYTYCSIFDTELEMPQMCIVEVDENDVPDGVPTFETKEELMKFLKEANVVSKQLVVDIEEWFETDGYKHRNS